MPSIEATPAYSAGQREGLLRVALQSIEHGLARGAPWIPRLDDYPERLQAQRATFVTLETEQALRGCIGVLEACHPLPVDVARNAFAAAFEDPRFPPLRPAELDALEIRISVLSPPEPLVFGSRDDLLAQIRPGLDGLILEDRGRRGTFLPAVWEQLPSPEGFLTQLFRKAGLPPEGWSDTLRVYRYITESFGAAVVALKGEAARLTG